MNSTNHSDPYDETALIMNASRGDLEAFNQLVLRYQTMAYNHARALLDDDSLAEDITQESFIKAFQAMNSFHGPSFRSWLLKIVSNSAFDIHRRARRHPTRPLFPQGEYEEEIESPNWLVDPTSSVEDRVEQNEFSKAVYTMLDELPDVYRSVLTLIDIYELDYAEAAEVLKIPIGTVKSRLARARFLMQGKLGGSFGSRSECIGTSIPCAA